MATSSSTLQPSRPFWLPGVFLIAALTSSLAFVPVEELDLPQIEIKIAILFGLAGTVFGYLLPNLRVGLFREVWQVPATTFFLSRQLLCICGTTLLGNALGLAILSLTSSGRYLPLLMMQLPVTIAFLIAASRRMRRDWRTEFVIQIRWRYVPGRLGKS